MHPLLLLFYLRYIFYFYFIFKLCFYKNPMLLEKNLHNYQTFSIQHILDNPYCALFLDMGMGKTISCLTAVNRLLFDTFEAKKVLVVAPKRVARDTWRDEVSEWAHVSNLSVSIAVGEGKKSMPEKKRIEAFKTKADVYCINRENVVWLVGYYGAKWPFDLTILDELSSYKSSKAARFKALKLVRPYMKRVVGLTGTPAPNGYEDLWAEMYLIDQGERLGKFKTHYIDRFFEIDPKTQWSSYPKRVLKAGAKETIHALLSDICISMQAEDYIDLPGRIHNVVKVHLSEEVMSAYLKFEESQVLAFPEQTVTAVNASSLRMKLAQFANGAVYDADKNYHVVHDDKLEVLDELIEAATSPLMIMYKFKHDLERMQKRYTSYKPRMLDSHKDQTDWNDGKIPLLFAHPASIGHGLNLQKGTGHTILWYGDPDKLEEYQQTNDRLDRQGQKEVVMIMHLVAVGTLEEEIADSLKRKAIEQDGLMKALKAETDPDIRKAIKEKAEELDYAFSDEVEEITRKRFRKYQR